MTEYNPSELSKPSEDGSIETPGFLRLNEAGLDIRQDVRQAVIEMMLKRFSSQFVASCVRIRSFDEWGGGLKSALVGRLELSVATGMKLGGLELHRDAAIMRAINCAGKPVCIEPLSVTVLKNGKALLLMEGLDKHAPVLDIIFQQEVSGPVQDRLVNRIVAGLAQIRKVRAADLAKENVPHIQDPYSKRLQTKLIETLETAAVFREEVQVLKKAGKVGGIPCPPIKEMMQEICEWISKRPAEPLVLAHGDLHLKNILVRRRGAGYSFRFIDPNSAIGFTDPLYDIGKLLHWAEELGWSQIDEASCDVSWTCSPTSWSLSANINAPMSAEQRRQRLEASILKLVKPLMKSPDDNRKLQLSIAAAHAGLLHLYATAGNSKMARFAAYYTLRSLLRWRTNTNICI